MSESPVWHPFTQHGLGADFPVVERGEGPYLHLADGRRLIDGISSWWVTTHGHNHPHIMAAIAAQSTKLDQVIFAGFTHEPAERLARDLVRLTPDGLDRVFFSDSGSTAVEVALKMALGMWHHEGQPQRTRIVVLEHGYHGDTIGAMSIGERGVFNRPYQPLLFDVETIPFPSPGAEQATLDALEAVCASGEACALIVEPLLLGAGGMLMYSAETLAQMHAICQAHDVVFIADEILTGWGRTGTLFACEQAGISPDILCTSKGLTGGSMPLAATLCSERFYQAHLSEDRAKMFFHSSSYTANPIACAAACANIELWDREPVLERVQGLQARQKAQLEALTDPRFENARQCGTITAIDLKVPDGGYLSDIAPKLHAWFLEQGVLLRPLGNTVYILPPYSISDSDLDEIYHGLHRAPDVLGL